VRRPGLDCRRSCAGPMSESKKTYWPPSALEQAVRQQHCYVRQQLDWNDRHWVLSGVPAATSVYWLGVSAFPLWDKGSETSADKSSTSSTDEHPKEHDLWVVVRASIDGLAHRVHEQDT